MTKVLHNIIDKEFLKQQVADETFERFTISFYRYVRIENLQEFRDMLYVKWREFNCLGRVYVAKEGINAQMNVPEHYREAFFEFIESIDALKEMTYRFAYEDSHSSFYKLTVTPKKKIVADGLDDDVFDVTNVGNHLSPLQFHDLVDREDTIVIDMRNHYESEVGHFETAICPDVDTFREEIDLVVEDFAEKKDEKILLYCTGGIRCEKASAYLKHHGFNDVNQLQGGIINYAHTIKSAGLKPKYHGKNFVFDERLGERIDDEVVSNCHQCGKPCDTHTNCKNDICHLLFIQCPECATKHEGCCTPECTEVIHLPKAENEKLRQAQNTPNGKRTFKSRLRPKLKLY